MPIERRGFISAQTLPLPEKADTLHREPRRTPRRAHLRARASARCRGRDVHTTRGAPVPRRTTGRVPDAPPNTAWTRAARTIRPGPTHLLPPAAPRHRRCPSGVRRLALMPLHKLLGRSTPPARRVVLVKPAGALSGRGQPLTRRRQGPGPTAVARSLRTDLGPRRPAARGPLHMLGRRAGQRGLTRHTRRLGIPVPRA